MEISQSNHVRFLEAEFVRRRSDNPRYSLRAFLPAGYRNS
jgi:hypothetical protein